MRIYQDETQFKEDSEETNFDRNFISISWKLRMQCFGSAGTHSPQFHRCDQDATKAGFGWCIKEALSRILNLTAKIYICVKGKQKIIVHFY